MDRRRGLDKQSRAGQDPKVECRSLQPIRIIGFAKNYGSHIGGGVANLGEVFLDPIRRFTDQRVFISAQGAYRIVACSFMDAAVPVGAALLARRSKGHVGESIP